MEVEFLRPRSRSPSGIEVTNSLRLSPHRDLSLSLLSNDPDLYASAVAMNRTIMRLQVPAKMATLRRQISDARQVTLQRLQETLAIEGLEVDGGLAIKLLDSLDEKLFEQNRIRVAAREEIEHLQTLFNQHDKGQSTGLARLLIDKNASLACQRWMNRIGAVCIDLCHVSFRACIFVVTKIHNRSEPSFAASDDPRDSHTIGDKLDKQMKDVQRMLHWFEYTGQELKTAQQKLQSLEDHRQPLQNLRSDITLMTQKKINVSVMNSSVFVELLKSSDLGHIADKFLEHHVNGVTFVDVMSATDFEGMGIDRPLDVRRLVSLQEKAKNGSLFCRTDALKMLVEHVWEHLDAYEKDAQAVEDLVSEWRTRWVEITSGQSAE